MQQMKNLLKEYLKYPNQQVCTFKGCCNIRSLSCCNQNLIYICDILAAAANADDSDDKSKPPVVQQKGRFKVTSENIDLDKVF